MTAAKPKRTAYDDAVEAELERWPGVTFRREVRSKHFALILTFAGVSRFVVYPCSPSDRKGALNHIKNIRQTLREMGAARARIARAARAKRLMKRHAPPVVLKLAPLPPARDPSRDAWAALYAWKPPAPLPPPRPLSWWVGIINAIRRLFGAPK